MAQSPMERPGTCALIQAAFAESFFWFYSSAKGLGRSSPAMFSGTARHGDRCMGAFRVISREYLYVLVSVCLLTATGLLENAAAQSGQSPKPTPTPLFSFRIALTATPMPDLVIPQEDLKLDPVEPFEGRTLFVRFTVKNVGNGRAEDITVDAYQRKADDPQAVPQTLTTSMHPDPIPFLAPGQSAELTMRWDAFDNAGNHSIEVIVDPQNRIQESNETNNSTSISFHVTPNYLALTEEGNWFLSQARQRLRQAVKQVEAYREWAPGDPRFLEELDHQFLVYLHLVDEDVAIAEKKAREALTVFPKNVPLSYLLASALLLREATSEALDVIESVSTTWGSTEDQLLLRVLREKDQDAAEFAKWKNSTDIKDVEMFLRTSVERLPGSPYSWLQLGLVLLDRGKHSEACEAFDRSFFLTRGKIYTVTSDWTLFNWTRALHAMRRDQEALEHLAWGIKHFKRPFNLLFQYATVGFESKLVSPHVALHFVDQIMDSQETPFWMTRLLYLRGRILEQLDLHEEAESAYRMSLLQDASYEPSIKALDILGATP